MACAAARSRSRSHWRSRREVSTTKAVTAAAAAPPPTAEEIVTVFKAMQRIQQTQATFGSRQVLLALLGWLTAAELSPAQAKGVQGFMLTIRCCSAAALEHAVRQLLTRNGKLSELEHASATDWAMSRELILGRKLVDVTGATGASDERLRRLADPRLVCSRSEWERVFGVRLARKSRWRAFESTSRVTALRRRVAAAGGVVDSSFPVRQLLTLAQPTDAIGEGWFSALGHFAQSTLHFAEVLTSEGVDALARYLKARQTQLGCTSKPIVEVGAGLGRLAHLLNATGMFDAGGGVIATDPQPDDQCEPHNVRFPLEPIDAAEAMRRHQPHIVLIAWMEFGADFTADLRGARVKEYVLIGEAGIRAPPQQTADKKGYRLLSGPGGEVRKITHEEHTQQMGSLCYSLNLSPAQFHPGYERVLLSEVSAELLHVHDAQDAEEGLVDAEGLLVAVSFRRR